MRPLLLAVLALLWSSPAPAQARVAQVGWLAGCWQLADGRRIVEEQWNRPLGGIMLGVGRTLQGDSLVEFEQVRLFARRGRLVYAAAPSGQSPAEFTSVSVITDMLSIAIRRDESSTRIVLAVRRYALSLD